jgi:energy-converting hydrogenase B subunit D
MNEIIALVLLGIISLSAAVFAIFTRKCLNAVIASGIISLMASIIFIILGAPDVAMTEATIGSGLTTVVFLYALKHVTKDKEKQDD